MLTSRLNFGLNQTLVLQELPQAAVLPCGVDVVLAVVKGTSHLRRRLCYRSRRGRGRLRVRRARRRRRDAVRRGRRLARLLGAVTVHGGRRARGQRGRDRGRVGRVCAVLLASEQRKLLAFTLRLNHALFEQELAKARLVPRGEGVVLHVDERFLRFRVLVGRPGGCGVPVGLDKVLELSIRVG